MAAALYALGHHVTDCVPDPAAQAYRHLFALLFTLLLLPGFWTLLAMFVWLAGALDAVEIRHHEVVKEVVVPVTDDDRNGADQDPLDAANIRYPVKHCVSVARHHFEIQVHLKRYVHLNRVVAFFVGLDRQGSELKDALFLNLGPLVEV